MSSKQSEERLQDAYNRMVREQMNMAMNPMQNAAQGSIFGGASASQGSILGGYSNQGVVGERRVENMFDYHRKLNVNVVTADNGFIVILRPEMPAPTSRVLVAATIEELRDLITSEMVTRKMEK